MPIYDALPSDTNKSLVIRLAQEFGVSIDLATYIAQHESRYAADKDLGDMDIVCKYDKSPFYGKPVRAKGILQITDCYHPEISDAQAFNVEWSLRWGLPLMKDKNKCLKEWSTCKDYYSKK